MISAIKKSSLALLILGSLSLQAKIDTHALNAEAMGENYIPRSKWAKIFMSEDGFKTLMSFHHTVTGCGMLPAEISNTPISILATRPADDTNEAQLYVNNVIKKEIEIANDIVKMHRNRDSADIAYHFMIGPSGYIYESRPLAFQGAHTFKLNEGNIGIAFLGCYDSEACGLAKDEAGNVINKNVVNQVTKEMIASAAKLIAHLSMLYGIEIDATKIWARSELEKANLGTESYPYMDVRFPSSPGDRIKTQMDAILELANAEKQALVAAQTSKKSGE